MASVVAKPFGLRDCLAFEETATTPTYGTGVDITCVSSFKFDHKTVEALLEGDDSICASHSNLEQIDVGVQNGGMTLGIYDLLFGGTLTDSGSGSTAQTILDFKVSDKRPYLGVIGQSYGTDTDSGDTLAILYRAKATGGGGGEFAKGKFYTGDFKFTCIPYAGNSDTIRRIVNRATAVAISTTWLSNPVHI